MKIQSNKAGIRDRDPIFSEIYPGPHGAKHWNGYGEREGKRWCIPAQDWIPGGVKLDEPIRKKLRGDEAGLLTDIDPPGVNT